MKFSEPKVIVQNPSDGLNIFIKQDIIYGYYKGPYFNTKFTFGRINSSIISIADTKQDNMTVKNEIILNEKIKKDEFKNILDNIYELYKINLNQGGQVDEQYYIVGIKRDNYKLKLFDGNDSLSHNTGAHITYDYKTFRSLMDQYGYDILLVCHFHPGFSAFWSGTDQKDMFTHSDTVIELVIGDSSFQPRASLAVGGLPKLIVKIEDSVTKDQIESALFGQKPSYLRNARLSYFDNYNTKKVKNNRWNPNGWYDFPIVTEKQSDDGGDIIEVNEDDQYYGFYWPY